MSELYQTDPSSIRSAQGDLLDELFWDRLSRFWKTAYRPEDKEALNCVYEAFGKVLDSEYIRLAEINASKSIDTCPVFTQRRWVRFDLDKYATVRAFLRYLAKGTTQSCPGSGTLACDATQTPHANHWHISLPWTLGGTRTLDLKYPITGALVEVYRMSTIDGREAGVRMRPGQDFTVTGTTITLNEGSAGDRYDVIAGLDLTEITDANPRVALAVSPFAGPGSVFVPASMSNGYPVHVLVVRNGPTPVPTGLTTTNNPSLSATFEFYPYTGNALTGAAHGVTGVVAFPSVAALTPADSVFVFGMDTMSGPAYHDHRRITLESIVLSTSPVALPTAPVPIGLFDSIDFLGQTVEVYIDGAKLAKTEYRYDAAANTLELATASASPVRLEILHTAESAAVSTPHLHQLCSGSVTASTSFARFDDNGDLDDGGVFDEGESVYALTLSDPAIDLETLEVYVAGYLLDPVSYVATATGGGTKLTFSVSVGGQDVVVSYRRYTGVFQYGYSDIVLGLTSCAGQMNITDVVVGDPSVALSGFAATGGDVSDPRILVDAARIAAAGGNPLFALFADEYPSITAYPIEADGAPIPSETARNLESALTSLVDIPFLVDQPHRPTVRLQAGTDYSIRDGEISSDRDLGSSWWVPILILDEHLLLKNFGAMLADKRDSSLGYRDALAANLKLRFGGPTIRNIAWSAAILAGSPAFTQDGKVKSVLPRLVGYDVTYVAGEASASVRVPAGSVRPRVGDPGFSGMSAVSPVIFAGQLVDLRGWTARSIEFEQSVNGRAGDFVFVQTGDLWARARATGYASSNGFTVVNLDRAIPAPTGQVRILRLGGAPYVPFDGTVSSVSRVEQWEVSTSTGEVFLLPEGAYPEQVPNALILRGQPLRPSLGRLYDEAARPGWYRLSAEQERPDIDFLVQGSSIRGSTPPEDERTAHISPGNGRAKFVFTRTSPLVHPGDLIQVGTARFTITGVNPDGSAWAAPNVSSESDAEVIIRPGRVPDAYFERPISGVAPEPLAYPQTVGSLSLALTSVAGFPQAGRISLAPAIIANQLTRGAIELEYRGISGTVLTDVTWLDTVPEAVLPVTWLATPVAAFDPYVLNPAFEAALRLRVINDAGGSPGAPRATAEVAEAMYPLLAPTTAVIETGHAVDPAVLNALFEDTLPPWCTVVRVSQHVISDVYDGKATDARA